MAAIAGVDNSNELHNKINEMLSGIVADMLSDWKG